MSFLDFLFPEKCLGCGQTGKYFCEKCASKIELIDKPICPVCVNPSPFGQTHPRCQTRYAIDGLTSVFAYSGIIRQTIKQLKYRVHFDLAGDLVTLILNSIKVKPNFKLDLKKTVVVPVPLHRWRRDWRGFNQAGLLAKILARELDLSFCEDLLVRKHYTQPQTGLKKEDREKNVKNAFEVNRAYKTYKTYKNVFLVDDVWTTGATMKICANLLKRNGFKKVWGLTVAR